MPNTCPKKVGKENIPGIVLFFNVWTSLHSASGRELGFVFLYPVIKFKSILFNHSQKKIIWTGQFF